MRNQSDRQTVITVMTCRDPQVILELLNQAQGAQLAPVKDADSLLEDLRLGVAFFVAYADAEPVGVLGYRWAASAMRVVQVAVKENHQRQGIARRLLQAVEAVGQALGTRNVTLEVPSAIQPLFERCGYAPSGEALRSDRPLWVKTLIES
jgi:GNAT superfamily N-acetyltransferase